MRNIFLTSTIYFGYIPAQERGVRITQAEVYTDDGRVVQFEQEDNNEPKIEVADGTPPAREEGEQILVAVEPLYIALRHFPGLAEKVADLLGITSEEEVVVQEYTQEG